MFFNDFKKASFESIGDFKAQIHRSMSTIKIDGKEYAWDPNDIMFYLDDTIKNIVQKKKKKNGLLTKQECELCETSLRKIFMNKRKCDF